VRILTTITYYRPYTSGLTIYAERLAKALIRRGHEVTVLTSRFDKDLKEAENMDGVTVLRVPVFMRLNKGVLMPSFNAVARNELKHHDALLLHLPQFDAAKLARQANRARVPTVVLYHSELILPPGRFNRFVNRVMDVMTFRAGRAAHRISAYTQDFANHSAFLQHYKNKVEVIPPAVELPEASAADVTAFASKHNPEGRQPVIGMATRFAAEKGLDLLLQALPRIQEKYPDALVWFAGQYQGVLGEEAYLRRLQPLIDKLEAAGQWKFLGRLDMRHMAAFYPNLDLLVVPSTNSTETFGFVQIEAMMNATPVVAADLPGVRQPVTMTGMGRISPVGDAAALADNILAVLDKPGDYQGDTRAIREQFSPATSAERHEALFQKIADELDLRL
jgi:glycosyltransferase involved in cell wall biosynthesis